MTPYVALAVLLPEELRLRRGEGFRGRPFHVEVFGKELDGALHTRGHDGPKRVLDDDAGRRDALIAVQDQHAGCVRLGRLRGESHHQQQCRSRVIYESAQIGMSRANVVGHGDRAMERVGNRRFCATETPRASATGWTEAFARRKCTASGR
jgi:hypothetical protein